MELFRKFVFDLPDGVMPERRQLEIYWEEKPEDSLYRHKNCGRKKVGFDNLRMENSLVWDAGKKLEQIFNVNQLVDGRTVILSPYANTLADLPDGFWDTIACKLAQRGYVVCTNSSGKKEPAVKGTIPIFFPLDIAPQFIQKAGYFIGMRSGFCDVISATDAKKIILYDKRERFFCCSAYEYFSLNHMGLCEDAVEIEFDSKKTDECVERIMGEFDSYKLA